MRIVIDCNVFVSAALGGKVCQQVIEKAFLECDIFYSNEILHEIQETFLKAKLKHAKPEGQSLLELIKAAGISIAPQPCPVQLPDSDDEIYLAVALGAEADAIITGNKKHFPEKKCRDIRIITPRQFLSATV
jgi:uncharacterized protein